MDDTYFDENGVERYTESDEIVPASEEAPSPAQVSAPAGPAPAATAPAAAPAASPVASPRNRMYMGENIGDPNATPKEFFDAQGTPNNTFVAPPPPQMSADQMDAALQQRITEPGGYNDQQAAKANAERWPMPSPEEEMIRVAKQYQIPLGQAAVAYQTAQRFQANRMYQQYIEDAKANGKPYYVAAQEAMALYGQLLTGSRYGYRPPKSNEMTEAQAANARMRQQQLDQQNAIANARLEVQKNKPSPPTAAVTATYRSLLAQETQATMDGDAVKANDARWKKDALIREHPELGLKPKAGTATGTTPGMVMVPVSTTKEPTKVKTQEEFDALPSGSIYIGTDGKRKRKP